MRFWRLKMLKISTAMVLCAGSITFQAQAKSMPPKGASGGSVHWNLSDWLAQKKSMSLQDLWLTTNTKNVDDFEGAISAAYSTYDYRSVAGTTIVNGHKNSQVYRANLYFWRIGVEGEFEKTNQRVTATSGALAFRLLGLSHQNTSLTIKYGLRQLESDLGAPQEAWVNHFAEADLVLYIIEFMGIQGNFRHYLKAKSDLQNQLDAFRSAGGVFFDIGWMRLYTDYYQEVTNLKGAGVSTDQKRQGMEYGARIFF